MNYLSLDEISSFTSFTVSDLLYQLQELGIEIYKGPLGGWRVEEDAFIEVFKREWGNGFAPSELAPARNLAEQAGVSPTIVYRRMDNTNFPLPSVTLKGSNWKRNRRYIPTEFWDAWMEELNQLPRLVSLQRKNWALEEVIAEWKKQEEEVE